MHYNIPKITVPDAIRRIVEAFSNDVPLMLHGSPGIGKSDAFHQAATIIAEDTGKPCRVIDLRLMLYDPVEVKGFQTIPTDGDQTRQLKPDYWPEAGEQCLIVCEEIVSALPATQAAAYQLFLDRAVGAHSLSPGQLPVGTGNLLSDRGVVNPIPTPLRDRAAHFQLVPKVDPWIDWAIDRNLRPEVVSFIKLQPDMLFTLSDKDELSFSTPRSLAKLSAALHDKMSKKEKLQWSEALLGKAVGSQFMGHFDLLRQLPNPLEVLQRPKKADVIGRDNPGHGFALAQSLAYYVTRRTMDNLVIYARRCSPETGVCMVKDAGRRKPELQETQAFIEFIAEFDPRA